MTWLQLQLSVALFVVVLTAASPRQLRASKAPPGPSADELQAQLDTAIQTHAAAFTIPPGIYNFSSNLNIHAASNLHINAAGATVWFNGTQGVNISNCDNLHIRGLSINYRHHSGICRHCGTPAITYNLLNCSDVISEDIAIYKAPFFSVTAFNGGGGHVFRRFHLPNDTATDPKTGRPTDDWPHSRDAFHFTDLRRGVLLEDSYASGFGDDFFNSHNTIMLVLRRETPTTLLVVNPHVQNVIKGKEPGSIIQNKNTYYGTNCVLENLRAGDSASFFGFPKCVVGSKTGACSSKASRGDDFIPPPQGNSACVIKGQPEQVTNLAVLIDAAALSTDIHANISGMVPFDASDIWRVEFNAPLPAAVGRASLVNIDSYSTPGTVIRNNTFIKTKYNLGRFKSNGGKILNNSFTKGGANLEISPLLQYFEGNLPIVRDVTVSGNTFHGEGTHPIHCSTMCGGLAPSNTSTVCPVCAHSPWATNISVFGNTFE